MYEGRTLATDGNELINYKTVIAYKKENKLFINISKYSTTTSKIQKQIKTMAKEFYCENEIEEYEG